MDKALNLYAIDHLTGEYAGYVMEAAVVDGEPVIMSLSTPIKPPTAPTGQVAVYLDSNGKPAVWWEDGVWQLKEDRRGTVYWLLDRSRHEITKIGAVPPDGALDADPGPSIDEVRTAMSAAIKESCAKAITAGFSSMALGLLHFYPSELTDQANLNASVTASLLPDVESDWSTVFMCADAAGVWAARIHTAAQIQQVGSDGKAAVLKLLAKKWQLDAQISAATTVDELNAIEWA